MYYDSVVAETKHYFVNDNYYVSEKRTATCTLWQQFRIMNNAQKK